MKKKVDRYEKYSLRKFLFFYDHNYPTEQTVEKPLNTKLLENDVKAVKSTKLILRTTFLEIIHHDFKFHSTTCLSSSIISTKTYFKFQWRLKLQVQSLVDNTSSNTTSSVPLRQKLIRPVKVNSRTAVLSYFFRVSSHGR